MELLFVVYRQYRWSFLGIIILSLISAALGIGLIAFINQRFIATPDLSLAVLPEFLGLLLILITVTLGSQLALTALGHHFVYRLRSEFIKRIMDTPVEHIERLGNASLMAGLTSDIRNITIAFVRLPELIQGIILTLGCTIYLGWLSLKMLSVTAGWVIFTIFIGYLLVARVYKHMTQLRETEDRLFDDYQTVLEGRKELALNRERAKYVYNDVYLPDAFAYRKHIIHADTFHLSAVNWSNIMMLGAIGLVFYMANSLGWSDTHIAATFSLTLLFLRTPLLSAVGALPTLVSAQVAFNKLKQFKLVPYKTEFQSATRPLIWNELKMHDVVFHYDDSVFSVGPLNLTIKRGELIFLIGGNGSGKSTLAMLLTGLYQPVSGALYIDDKKIDNDNIEILRACFSAVFTDHWLFDRFLGAGGMQPNPDLLKKWLARFKMEEKLKIKDGKILNLKLSKGQRKRIALLMALAEEREIILLDEWAADQDPHFRQLFYQTLLPMLKQMGKTVFAISHDDRYFSQADKLLEMRKGELRELTGKERAVASKDAVSRTDNQ